MSFLFKVSEVEEGGAQLSGGAVLFHQDEVSGGQAQDSQGGRGDGSFVPGGPSR